MNNNQSPISEEFDSEEKIEAGDETDLKSSESLDEPVQQIQEKVEQVIDSHESDEANPWLQKLNAIETKDQLLQFFEAYIQSLDTVRDQINGMHLFSYDEVTEELKNEFKKELESFSDEDIEDAKQYIERSINNNRSKTMNLKNVPWTHEWGLLWRDLVREDFFDEFSILDPEWGEEEYNEKIDLLNVVYRKEQELSEEKKDVFREALLYESKLRLKDSDVRLWADFLKQSDESQVQHYRDMFDEMKKGKILYKSMFPKELAYCSVQDIETLNEKANLFDAKKYIYLPSRKLERDISEYIDDFQFFFPGRKAPDTLFRGLSDIFDEIKTFINVFTEEEKIDFQKGISEILPKDPSENVRYYKLLKDYFKQFEWKDLFKSLDRERQKQIKDAYMKYDAEVVYKNKELSDIDTSPKDVDLYHKSNDFYNISFDAKYRGTDTYEWIENISPEIKDDVLKYLASGNGNADFSEMVSDGVPVSLDKIQKDYDIPEKDMKDLERVFQKEVAPWKQRKEIIDFLSFTGFGLQTTEEFETLKKMTKQMSMHDAALGWNNLSKDIHENMNIQEFEIFCKFFGASRLPETYRMTQQILNSHIPEKVSSFVDKTGENGVQQLKTFMKSKIKNLVHNEADIDFLNLDNFEKEIYRYALRFDQSEWSRDIEFDDIVQQLQQDTQNDLIRNADPAYEDQTPSFRSLPVDFDISHFEEKYVGIRKAIREGRNIQDLDDIQHKLRSLIEEQIHGKQQLLENAQHEGQKRALEGQKKSFEKILHTFQKQEFKKTEDLLRFILKQKPLIKQASSLIEAVVIHDFLEKNPSKVWKMEMLENDREISVRNVRELVNIFKNHIQDHALGDTNNEHYKNEWLYPNLTDKERKILRKVVSTRGLEEIESMMARVDGGETTDEYKLQPSRGVLGEMSGYIADACWTSQRNILRENPNMTPVICVQNPEKNPELVGASLLFENSILNGEKVLLLRGIDPQDRMLEKVSASSFCESMIEYAKDVAQKKGIKYIMACTDNGVISNRPGVVRYFQEQYPKKEGSVDDIQIGQKIPLDKDMNFNGYEITDKCLVVDIV